MGYKVIGLSAGQFGIDDRTPFSFVAECESALFNGAPIDLERKGRVTIVRTRIGDDHFIELVTKPDEKLWIGFQCRVKVTRVSPHTIEVQEDNDSPYAIGVEVSGLYLDDIEIPEFLESGSYTYQRQNGESPSCIHLKLVAPIIRLWFQTKLTMSFIATVNTGIPDRLWVEAPITVTGDRLQAWAKQQAGYQVHKPGLSAQISAGYGEPWEKIELTPEEEEFLHQQAVARRQRQFEEACREWVDMPDDLRSDWFV